MQPINVFEYEPKYQPCFEQLNRAWIEKYFHIEKVDEEVITHPDEMIIDHGGTILFASVDEEVVGTVALKKMDDETFELCKMAVSEKARGKHIGLILGEEALKKAKELGAKQVILYSQRTFNQGIAVNLYHRLGFKEVKLEKGGYERCDIKMIYDFMMHDYLEKTANRLREIVKQSLEKFKGLSSAQWNEKSSLKEWSKKEILGHLIDSAANNHQRFVRAQYADQLVSPKYQQDDWVIIQNYQHENIQAIIDLWQHYNLHLAFVIENIHPLKLETRCVIGDDQPVTLQFLVEDYIVHLQHHLQEILGR